MSPVYLLTFTVSFFIKKTCCKVFHKKYGDKTVKRFNIFSLLLACLILLSILRLSPEDSYLFSILNGLAWGFVFSRF